MFISLFNTLKATGVPCTLRELLDLIGCVEKELAFANMEDFYFLSRATLVKDEKHYDKFDRAFDIYFKGIESIDDILEMHLLQRKILWAASDFINPGGVIVYSTCSVEPEENYMVIDAFLKSHPNYSIESAKDYVPSEYVDKKGALFTCPIKHNIDGGYAFRLICNGK